MYFGKLFIEYQHIFCFSPRVHIKVMCTACARLMKTPLPNLAVDVMASKTLAKDTHIVGVVVQKKGGGLVLERSKR